MHVKYQNLNLIF